MFPFSLPKIKDETNQSRIASRIEIGANLGIIFLGCLLAVILVNNHVSKRPNRESDFDPSSTKLTGTKLSPLDVDWQQSKQTLLLAISTSCHFCFDSAPFYKRLIQNKRGTHIVAIFPTSIQSGERYLKQLEVSVDEVRQEDFANIGVNATPTLLLVDNSGVVKMSWIGKLPAEQEESVLQALFLSGD